MSNDINGLGPSIQDIVHVTADADYPQALPAGAQLAPVLDTVASAASPLRPPLCLNDLLDSVLSPAVQHRWLTLPAKCNETLPTLIKSLDNAAKSDPVNRQKYERAAAILNKEWEMRAQVYLNQRVLIQG